MSTRRQPLLKAEHFSGSETRLTNRGLQFEACINDDVRGGTHLSIGESFDETDGFLQAFAGRTPTRIVANPSNISTSDLHSFFESAQENDPLEKTFNVLYGLKDDYQRCWMLEGSPEETIEGQTVVLVAFDGSEPVGFATVRLSVARAGEGGRVHLLAMPKLVYVTPSRRGRGYGIDLSIAISWLLADTLKALYRAVPAGSVISVAVSADYESKGGEAITRYVFSELESAVDMLVEHGKRRSIEFDDVELGAAY
jgi:GNAT superfamily N-acetyltransferase